MNTEIQPARALNVPDTNLERIIVIGCGFAGLNLVKELRNQPYQVVMIDKHNYHTFQPLLYQVATAGLEPDSIAYPIRHIFKNQKNFFFRMAIAEKIDPARKVLSTNIGELDYDQLVIATGSSTNYFGMDNVEKFALPMKNVPEALNLRSIILQNFEAASLTSDLEERERLMNFVIIGAGPTGVEMAGAMAELRNHVLPRDYPDLDFRRMSIHLVEMMNRVLPPMSEQASRKSQQYLEKLGVTLWLETQVQDYDGRMVKTNRKDLPAYTCLWTAGVKGAVIPGLEKGKDYDRSRYLVNRYSQVGVHKNIFALGDVAAMITEDSPKGHPMLAQVAIQQAKNLAENLKRTRKSQEWVEFSYKDLGTMATIGRNKAVADLGRLRFGGFIGWFLWMGVHLRSLVGFRNRLVVLVNWVINYFSYDKKIRLIIRPVVRLNKNVRGLSLEKASESVSSDS